MVWAVTAYITRPPLVLIPNTMKAQWYVHDILQPHVLPLMQRLRGAIFQPDNSRHHTERVSEDCLRTFTTLLWPARFQDLSPIEQYACPLGTEVHEQMSRSGGQSEVRPTVFLSPQASVVLIYRSTSVVERLDRPCPARE
ncbi:transposable element Tcb1 transposase [Trichonephila clavipes]|nr:transposable element Tcb1 transposase [Trichonephila clavipes]